MEPRKFLRTRLALRIYLIGLAQFVVIVVGFVALVELSRQRDFGPRESDALFVQNLTESMLDNPTKLNEILKSAREDLHAIVTIFDADDKVLATNAEFGIPPCRPAPQPGNPPPRGLPHSTPHNDGPRFFGAFRGGPPHPALGCRVTPIRFPDGRMGRIEQNNLMLPPPISVSTIVALVLVVVGISSLLLARSLTKPLNQLSTAARALGTGNLKARANLKNRDEFGDVSRAFDEMAERVAELLRAERELLANVSHELRTPLSRIRMALALVSEAEGDVAVAQEMLAEIGADLDELERLIADVLTAARLDFEDAGASKGIPPLRREYVDLGDLLEHAASRFRAAHPTRTLQAKIADDLPAVNADPVLLRRVFDNLLENAHKYTDAPDKPIELVAKRDGDIVVDVIDHGIGIAADDLTRVLQPFYRVDKSRTRATGGLGLGLPLAKRIVEAHGGKIELTSVVDEGTRARVRLPIESAPN